MSAVKLCTLDVYTATNGGCLNIHNITQHYEVENNFNTGGKGEDHNKQTKTTTTTKKKLQQHANEPKKKSKRLTRYEIITLKRIIVLIVRLFSLCSS